MNLEQLKAEAREKLQTLTLAPMTSHAETLLVVSYEGLDHLIEHTHTQTIQSVRERIKSRIKPITLEDRMESAFGAREDDCYNQALTDLLKDLEALVEATHPISEISD